MRKYKSNPEILIFEKIIVILLHLPPTVKYLKRTKNGIKDLKKAFSPTILSKCIALTDIQYATGNFEHPDYTNQNRTPLTVKLKEIPIYLQTDIRKIDINKDVYQMGSTPIIIDDTGYVPDFSSYQRRGNDTNRNMDF